MMTFDELSLQSENSVLGESSSSLDTGAVSMRPLKGAAAAAGKNLDQQNSREVCVSNAVAMEIPEPDHVRYLRGVTPTPVRADAFLLSDDEKIAKLIPHFEAFLDILGLDREDDSIKDTPRRMAKMYVKELCQGLNPANFPKITAIENKMNYDQMLVEKDIKVMSLCEHHAIVIQGVAHVAYIPKKKVIGLSKLNRIVDFFSRRPQVQERLTQQIADCLQNIVETEDVAVYIEARHFCVISRGIQDVNSSTISTDLRGAFKSDAETRGEFLSLCRKA
jgi:GTP cyclohydrolase IA